MRILLYIVLLVAMLFAPVKRLDIAKLEPVEAVAVYREADQVVLQTDGDNVGRGDTVAQALEDLKANAPAIIYLDTADYLLVAENARDTVDQLRRFLKGSVQIGSYLGGDVKEEARILDVHGNAAKPEG